MKVAVVALALFAAFAAPSFAATTTIGDLVEGLCPDAKLRLDEAALLKTALTLASTTEVVLPDSGIPMLFAPSDAALNAALAELGVSALDLAGDPNLIKEILSLHLATATSEEATDATTVNGKEVMFMVGTDAVTVGDFVAATADRSLMEGQVTANAEDVITCPDGLVAVFMDKVFLPSAAPGPNMGPAPVPAPVPAPTPSVIPVPVPVPVPAPTPSVIPTPVPSPSPAPAPAPASSASAATFGIATIIAMVLALLA